ncbi:MAG: nuclear transport factor 2 family protein [Rhodanobacteraceae bacterium]
MNLHAARALVVAATAALPAMSPAAKTGDVPAATRSAQADDLAVTQLEQRWIADIERGDRDDLAAMLADDYRDIDWQGRIRDKQAVLAAIAKPSGTSQHIRNLRVRAWGDTAVATGTNEVHSAAKGWTAEVSFSDVFARIDGHWRAVASQETLRKSPGSRAQR